MKRNAGQFILINIPLLDERYGRTFLLSIAIHGAVILLLLFGNYLLPHTTITIGGSPGGGDGGEIISVGVADDLGGGIGMTKPSLMPKPSALPDEPAKVNESKAIPIPQTMEKNKKPEKQTKKVQSYKSNVIPTAPEPGAGGSGGRRGGIGGGNGGGVGISLGPGSGGLGDNYYARAVEFRISDNWNKLPKGMQADMTFSFYIDANGNILGIKQEKSSGNPDMDALALRAIQNSNPLDPPPPEFRKRLIQFVARFVYPPHN